jgi:putative aldouronate transport system substrate-binding protein
MYGLPNTWRVDANGRLTNVLEMPAYKDALNTARELWAAGVYSPKSTQYIGGGNGVNDFEARQFAFMFAAFPTAGPLIFSSTIDLDPPASYRVVAPFGASADITPTYWAGGPGVAPGARGYSVLKKASPERIKELLRVLNWIAAPFGSQEYLLMHYGVRNIDYTLDDQSNPVLTQQGKADTTIPWAQITAPPPALYLANHPEYAQVMQAAEQQLLPVAQIDPTSALYSETAAVKGRMLRQMVSDGVGEVVLGRAPVSSIDQLVTNWRAQGGDQVRAEFEQAIAAAGS